MLSALLWTIIVVALIVWIVGLIAHFAGSLIWIALAVAVVLFFVNLLTGRRTTI